MPGATLRQEAAAQHDAIRAPGRAAISAWVGSALEYYDFFIYGIAAALVFGKVFFPTHEANLAELASFATFGIAYVARPIGAVILGHVGDRFGRKKVLTFTLYLMGASTFLIGVLPSYEAAGSVAPMMLVALRLLQGLSAAGEQASASSMTLEHAPAHRRALYTSFTVSGIQAGFLLATLAFLPVAALPEADLLAWGWRIPFLLSLVVVIAGVWIRRSLPETPAFDECEQAHLITRFPVAVVMREHASDVLRVILCALVSVVITIFSVFTVSFAVNQIGISRSTMLTVLVLSSVIGLVAIPLWALLADRVGRKPIFIFGALGSAALIWPYLAAIVRADVPSIYAFGLLLAGVVYSAANSVWPALCGEMFDTRVRLSGTAIGSQIGIALGGFAPTISATLMVEGAGAWMLVAAFTSGAALLAALSALSARETYRVGLSDLGRKFSPALRDTPRA